MENRQKGFTRGIVALVAVLVIAGALWFTYHRVTANREARELASEQLIDAEEDYFASLRGTDSLATAYPAIPNTGDEDTERDSDTDTTDRTETTRTVATTRSTTYVAPKPVTTQVTYTPVYVAPASIFPGGIVYHNNIYGLTLSLPANWAGYSVTQTQETYANVPALATYNFFVGGEETLTINVFTKEQWNNIRIQETQDIIEGEASNRYFGEGTYLGENTTYIFSYEIHGHDAEARSVVTNARFY